MRDPPPASLSAGPTSPSAKRLAVFVSLLLAALSTFEYVKVSYDKCFHEFPVWHHAHMANRAAAPLQYRVLSYAIPECLSRAGVPVGVAYVVERGVFLAAASYVFFFFFCRAWLGVLETIFASTVLAFFYTLSAFPHIQPSEEINLFAFALGLSFIQRRAFWPLVWCVAIGAANKETVGFLIPFFFLRERRLGGDRPALYARTAVLLIALGAVYAGIRATLGTDRPYMDGLWQLRHNALVMKGDPFLGSIFLLPSLGPALWIFRRRVAIDPFFVDFLPALVLFVAGHLAISHVDEFRTYAPLALVTIPGALVLLRTQVSSTPCPA
jgi:hypothetical protein